MVEEARVPEQPPTIGKQLVNFIIRVYGIKYKIFHEQVLIKSSRNETLVLSIWIRILVPNFPSTTAWDHMSDPSSKSAMCPNGIYTGGRLHTYWIRCNPLHGALLQVPLETFYQPPTLPHQGQSDQSPVIKTRDLIKTE